MWKRPLRYFIGTNATESSSSTTRQIPITTSSSGNDLSSRITRSRSRPVDMRQNASSVVTNSSSLVEQGRSDSDSDDDIFHDATSFAHVDDEEDAVIIASRL